MKSGIYAMPESDYQADAVSERPSLSASIAKILIAESPLHAWTAHPRLNPNFEREDREIFDLGTVAHALMLQGIEAAHIIQAVNKEGNQVSDWRTSAARIERETARAAGKIPILAQQWDRIKAMVDAGKRQLAAHKEASDVFTDAGKPEQTITWEDDHGIICRGKLDWLRNDFRRIGDYKSTGTSVNPNGIARYALSQHWDLQSSFYRRGIKKITGVDAEFFFVGQEDFQPHALCVIGMDPSFQYSGDDKVQRAIDKWAECLDLGEWPGYPDRVCYPELPAWAESEIEERQMREAI